MNERELGFQLGRSARESGDVAALTFVVLAQSEQIDDVTITEHPGLFAEWNKDMALPALKAGLIVRDEGLLYRLIHTLQDITQNRKPKNTPTVWACIGNPAEEWPAWVPWVGGMDLYMTGHKVTHQGKHWISTVDNNVWEPSVFGWAEA